jgi:DNA-binding MarR family transcriptional regulator
MTQLPATTNLDLNKIIQIYRLKHFIAEILKLSSELPLQAVNIFLNVAAQPGITSRELMAQTKMSQSSISRNVALLSDVHRSGSPGLGLIFTVEDPLERRRKLIYLSDDGKKLAATLGDIVR